MGSMGEISVGERRSSWSRPGKSAILGMVAAALGYDRSDEEKHQGLETGLFYAVRVDSMGRSFSDWHTAQTPQARSGAVYRTRKEELEDSDGTVHTVLSHREWRTDTFYTVALWQRHDSNLDLDKIRDALRKPVYSLYLGRKSAPIGLPMNPVVVEAEALLEAFNTFDEEKSEDAKRIEDFVLNMVRDGQESIGIAFDYDINARTHGVSDDEVDEIVTRRDSIGNRGRWQFANRLEGVHRLKN